MQIVVMPAWMAGTQVRKDACAGDIHVNLDSSTPCWNDESRVLLKVTEAPSAPYFQRNAGGVAALVGVGQK